jgi:tRNA-modifying protein YgfZ
MTTNDPTKVIVFAPSWGTLRATGPDAGSWLNSLLTCDLGGLAAGVGTWGLLLTKRGKIVAETNVLPISDGVLIGTASDTHDLVARLDEFLVMEDVELEDLGSSLAWLQFHGQRAGDAAARHAGSAGAHARIEWTPTGGAAIAVPHAELARCLKELAASPDVEILDRGAFQAWRIRHGVPLFGVDYGSEDNPHEAGLDRRAVSWTKGCYLGQEVVCMQDMRGKVKRRLARLDLGDATVASAGDSVHDDAGEVVGSLTSVTPEAAGNPFCAIARLRAPHFEPGSAVRVGGKAVTAAPLWG